MFLPISSNNGFTLSNADCAPPIMIVSAAFLAPTSPPDTGASRYSQPSSLTRLAYFLVSIGEIELMSTTIFPFDRPSATPPAPNNTFSTSGVSGTMVMMMSAFCAASLALAHPVPPAAVNSWGTPLRECRKSLCPPLIRLSAMGLPMMPRPINPILLIWGSFLICRNEEMYLLLAARDAKDASLVYRLAFLRLALPQVRLRPAQSVLSFRGRLVFAADPALIADFIDVAEQKVVIDFAGPRLVTARRIGELHMRDQL